MVEGLHALMHALVHANLNSSYKVGHTDNVSITHLHLGDDTLLVENTSLADIKSLKALLLLFWSDLRSQGQFS